MTFRGSQRDGFIRPCHERQQEDNLMRGPVYFMPGSLGMSPYSVLG